MAIKTELINGWLTASPRGRLSFYATGINPDRLDQIKEAIRSYFPEWAEDEWWWTYYQHERIVLGAIDGRSFDEETKLRRKHRRSNRRNDRKPLDGSGGSLGLASQRRILRVSLTTWLRCP